MMIQMTATSTITVMTLENDYHNDDYDDGDDDLQVVKQSPPAPFVSLNSSSAPSGRERESAEILLSLDHQIQSSFATEIL